MTFFSFITIVIELKLAGGLQKYNVVNTMVA